MCSSDLLRLARADRMAALRLARPDDVPGADADQGGPGGPRAEERPGRLAAILGVARRTGGWGSRPATVVAVAGYARVDLRDAAIGAGTAIRANAVLGVVTVVVPPGTYVAEAGIAVLGLRLGGGISSDPTGRPLVISGLCLLGLVRVTTGRPQAAGPGIGSGWAAGNRQIAPDSGPSESTARASGRVS